MADRIQQRRDTAARWAQYNPILLEGETGYVTDNPNQYKIGDGVHAWNDLPLRGYDGTIVQELGDDENAVVSQKVITELLQTKTDDDLQTSIKTVVGGINEIAQVIGLTKVTPIEITAEYSGKCINNRGVVVDSQFYSISQSISLEKGQALIGKLVGIASVAILAKDNGDGTYEVIMTGTNNSPYRTQILYIASEDINIRASYITTNIYNKISVFDVKLFSQNFNLFLTRGKKDVGYSELNYDKLSIRSNLDPAMVKSYNEGLLDVYIDKTLFPDVETKSIIIWNYQNSLYVGILENSGSSVTYIINNLGFSKIENYVPINLVVEDKVIGYIVFCDKQKFMDYSVGSGPYLNLEWACNPLAHPYLWVYKQAASLPIKLEDTNFSIKYGIGNNLANPETITRGSYYIDDTTGKVGSNFGYGYTDYIPITNSGLVINPGYVWGKVIGHAVYDMNKNYIRGYRTNIIDYQEGDAYVRFSIGNSQNIMVNKGTIALPYEEWKGEKEIISTNVLPKIENPSPEDLNPIEINLPDKIYAVVGDTLQLFYRGMIQAVDPYRYNIVVACSKGKQTPRYFEYTPTTSDVGTTTFKITVKDDNRNILATKSCELITVNLVQAPASDLKVMCFGDSLTARGIWCAEADRRLTGEGGTPAGKELTNISFVGSKTNGTTGYFGVGGWTWKYYTQPLTSYAWRFQVSGVSGLTIGAIYLQNEVEYKIEEVNVTEGTGNILCSTKTETTPDPSGTLTKKEGSGDATITYSAVSEDSKNPLWDIAQNKMSFISYANEVADGRVDVVYTLLTWNGLSGGKTNFSDVLAEVKIFADTLHSEFPNAKLKIMGIQVPSVRGGMGSSYGATGGAYADGYAMVVTAFNMNKAYQNFANQEEYKDFVEFVNVSSQFDTDYSMPHTDKAVNTRSTVKEWVDTNGVHPSNEGYYQIADVVYRNFIANFCQ